MDKNLYPNNSSKRNKLIATIAGLGLSLGGISACSNGEYKAPELAGVEATATPNSTSAPSAETLPSSQPSTPEPSASALESGAQTLDTNYDEIEIVKQINSWRPQAVEKSIAALEIAKNPELAAQLGMGEVWWQAQIDIANAYIAGEDTILNSPGDPNTHGFSRGMGLLSKAMLPLFASGLKMAQENNIPPVSTENNEHSVIINGQEVGPGNLGIYEWIMTKAEIKFTGNLCIDDYYKPFDENSYTRDNPLYANKDDLAIEVIKQQDKTIHAIVDNYIDTIDAHC